MSELTKNSDAALRAQDVSALWHPFTQMTEYARETPAPPIITHAEGNWLIANDGQKYLDANCGYWCLALGCRPDAVERAVKAQLDRFAHSTLLGISHEPAIQLASRLVELAGDPFKHVFFADSGSEAVEAALKMVYQFHVHGGQPERSEFLALGDSYHGDTLGAVSVGGVDLFHAAFKPLLFPTRRVAPPRCYRCAWKGEHVCGEDAAAAMENALAEHAKTLAAVVIEPFVLGPGGVLQQPKGYLERVVRAARKHGVPVIFDEVAVGMGRLGTLFAFEQLADGLRPDVVCLAKGLTGGVLPLSAVMTTTAVYERFLGTAEQRRTFFHGHTFTGSALGCAAALAALETLSDTAFQRNLQEKTIPALWKMLGTLCDQPHVGDVRGRGMMAAFEVVKDAGTREDYPWHLRYGHRVVLAARKRNVNLRAIGDVVLCVPPLTITLDEIELLGRVYRESVAEATGEKS